jgi:aspartyl/glutamyl-tRNA(Asn/Gln) amidotransferase C subunit
VHTETLQLIEQLSLLAFDGHKAINRFRDSVTLANRLKFVEVSDVEPLYSMSSDIIKHLRDDVVSPQVAPNHILECAEKTLDGYYIAPSGSNRKPDEETILI